MDTRVKYLAYSPCVTASLSLIGSSLTLLTIYRACRGVSNNGPRTPLRTYHRLLIGISLSDILLSISFALGPFPTPVSPSTPWAHGTIGTCTFQGVFAQLGSASFAYSLMLMVYYVLVIRFNRSDSWISTWAEPFMHIIPIGYFGSVTIAGLILQVFNPIQLRCWVGVYPADCLWNPNVPCQRGQDYVYLFGAWLTLIPFFVINFLIILALILISWTVWRQHAASSNYVVGRRSHQQTRQVIVQCFLYALSFISVMLWSTMGSILTFAGGISYDSLGKHYWIAVLSITFFPLQGLSNFLVFIRPRFLKKRQIHHDQSRLVALREAIWNPSSASFAQDRARSERSIVLRRASHNADDSSRHILTPSPSSSNLVVVEPTIITPVKSLQCSLQQQDDLEAGEASTTATIRNDERASGRPSSEQEDDDVEMAQETNSSDSESQESITEQ